MPSGRLVCRCHDVFLWCYIVLFCFVFVFNLSLKPRSFVQSSFDMQAPRQPHVFLILSFFWRCRFFRVFFVPFTLSLCMESASYVLSFRMVFFYLVTTGWIFDISLCDNSISSIKQPSNILFYYISVLFASRRNTAGQEETRKASSDWI